MMRIVLMLILIKCRERKKEREREEKKLLFILIGIIDLLVNLMFDVYVSYICIN